MCDCGKELDYTDCCGVFHQDITKIKQPQQLMRARYCAFVRGNDNFISLTDNPAIAKTDDYYQAVHTTGELNWVNLEIVETSPITDNQGYVTFKASYIEDDKIVVLEEKSRFEKKLNSTGAMQWFYMDGKAKYAEPIKIGRNDVCPCGSGKKYKKCCANR